MLLLIENLVKALEAEGVLYCHWKSNLYSARAAHGEDDLDLLVGQASRQAFLGILDHLGFKEATTSKRKRQIPGILSYYGYDETASRLIHVHLHYKLILGHDLTKNYHLPVENAYLESSRAGEYFRIPATEFELAVFVIRMVLKYSTWNTILGGQGKLSDRERKEMEFLLQRAPREKMGDLLAAHLPFLGPEILDECIRALQTASPLFMRIRAGHRLQKALRGCRLRSGATDVWLQVWRRLAGVARQRLLRSIPGKRLKNGGMLMAFVGGDGSGKTTVIEGISKWLSPQLATVKIHMGKPSWSRLTILTRGILKIGRVLRLWPFEKVPVEFRDEESPVAFPGYPSLIRAVCTARDRYLSYVKARRYADQGVFVICDRFPLPEMISMDGPQVDWLTRTLPSRRFIRFLNRLEKRYYQAISRPDLLCVLRADPETAVERKTEESAASVRVRTKEIWEKDWNDSAAHVIDAGQAKAEVLRRAKELIWAHL